ncbi:Hypothetical protein CINCED_3A004579 [Cinara cedri]|uniref:Uncharacterized protein n=1 Tax=Cinara cedri TaxID=506608 RepID=A0A5E4NII2_9HEMI|nr:Hypothetical protein CINCED_3A004579 [Cinara cedri]
MWQSAYFLWTTAITINEQNKKLYNFNVISQTRGYLRFLGNSLFDGGSLFSGYYVPKPKDNVLETVEKVLEPEEKVLKTVEKVHTPEEHVIETKDQEESGIVVKSSDAEYDDGETEGGIITEMQSGYDYVIKPINVAQKP